MAPLQPSRISARDSWLRAWRAYRVPATARCASWLPLRETPVVPSPRPFIAGPELRERAQMSSANSINLGRLLPQAVYYATSSLRIRKETGQPASYIIPSGNLGNSVACICAKQLGFPIDRVLLAHNANRTVVDFLATGELRPRPSIPTLASAMDVGNPSNLERMLALF